MKQKIKNLISLKTASVFFGLLFFVAIVGVMTMQMPSALAAAPTGFTSQTYEDSDSDGVIDQVAIVINGGEALTTCTVTDVEIATDWTYVGNDIGGSLVSSGDTHTCVLGTAIVTLKITGANANTTGHATAPTIAYDNDDADNSIVNASGILGTVVAANITDGAAPTAALTYSDADGIVKSGDSLTITATFNEAMADSPVVQIALSGANTVTAVNMTKATTTSYTYIHTVAAGNGTVTAALSIGTDVATNVITSAPTSGATFTVDNTAPVMISAVYKDTDGDIDEIVDEIVVTYLEDIAGNSTFTEGEWSFLPNPHGLAVGSVTFLTTDVHIAITSSLAISDVTDDTTVVYTAADGIVDDAGNYAASAEFPISAEEDEDDDEDEDTELPDGAVKKQKQPNPNSGVTLYRVGNDPRVYVIKNKKRRWIKTVREFERNGYNWDEIQEISAELLEEFPEAEALVTELLKAIGDYRVYRLEEGKKSWIKTAKEFEDCGYNWGNIQEVSPETLASYQNLVSSGLLRVIGNNKVYKIENGKKRWIKTAGEFNAAGYRWGDVEEVTTETLDDYPDSE